MKIVYLPLDERPCNWHYPQAIAALQSDLALITPPRPLLGQKKQPADLEQLRQWLLATAANCDGMIVSIEMVVYGGLLPSRLHQESIDELLNRLNVLRQLKAEKPSLFILASNLVMRSPTYDSSEEEPDYYGEFGEAIFRWGWLADKGDRQELTAEEQLELDILGERIPTEHLSDYRQRRVTNCTLNQAVIDLVKTGVIDFLSIPQDDSAEYGFTAMDQRIIYGAIYQERLQHKIHGYPGADEVGCTLLSHAYVHYFRPEKSPIKIYPLFSSVNSEKVIPLYEDRPLGESLKAHILAAGGLLAASPGEAELILAVNTSGQDMQESWDQEMKLITYSTGRNLRYFVADIAQLLKRGKSVAIADVAFANGGETELVQMLDDQGLLDQLRAYAGWNTTCNTLGTAIATGILALTSSNRLAIQSGIVHRLLEDWLYQGIVRSQIIHDYLPTVGASYYDFGDQEGAIADAVKTALLHQWTSRIRNSFCDTDVSLDSLTFPWHRMFEVDIKAVLTPKCLRATFQTKPRGSCVNPQGFDGGFEG